MPAIPLIDRLRDEPQRFDLYRVIQLLELGHEDEEGPGGPGSEALPVRFAANQSLSFPAHEVQRLALPKPAGEEGEPDQPATIDLNALTLTGPVSALPQIYTETAIRSIRDRAPGFVAFLDMFNDRIATLFYRAWRRHRLPALYERKGMAGGDMASAALFSVAGFGTPHLRGRLKLQDEILLFYAGLFSQ